MSTKNENQQNDESKVEVLDLQNLEDVAGGAAEAPNAWSTMSRDCKQPQPGEWSTASTGC